MKGTKNEWKVFSNTHGNMEDHEIGRIDFPEAHHLIIPLKNVHIEFDYIAISTYKQEGGLRTIHTVQWHCLG